MRTGLCSVTLRSSSPEEIVTVAAHAGLQAIEWGADVHARPGDVRYLTRLACLTADAGLAVAALGSYVFLGADDQAHGPTVAAAVALGAPRIRAWAGRLGSADASTDDRARVTDAARDLTARAAEAGIRVGLEFHGGTLTDTPASTLALLADVDHPMLGTYWQPPLDTADDVALAGLNAVLPHLLAVHAFSWWPGTQRRPLMARSALWRAVGEKLAATMPLDVLLEFVPDDAPAAVCRDADSLRALLPCR